jgi:polyisoprenoid-binding protein YceI
MVSLASALRQALRTGWPSGIVALWAVFAGTARAAESYTLDVAHSIPVIEFTHLGVTTQSGRFDKAAGVVTLDLDARSGSVNYEVDSASLNMGFGTETPESPGYLLFEVKKFPKITFRSNKLRFDQNRNVVAAEGQLTLLGVSQPLTVTINRFKCSVNPLNKKQMCAGEVTAAIKRSEFGMVKYIPGISDEIRLRIPVEAYKD